MARLSWAAILFLGVLVRASPTPDPPRALTGKFLQLTDVHPDGLYKYNSSVSRLCHADEKEEGDLKSGYWGTPVSICDSPVSLVDSTFEWLSAHHSTEFDFIVWTGDNARHDIDVKHPRTFKEIVAFEKQIAEKIAATFPGIPIVSAVGNNDIHPHQIMAPGPSKVTRTLGKIWKPFIPKKQRATFKTGAYYAVEAIPNELLLISLNSIYWFKSNQAVGGCPLQSRPKKKKGPRIIDPGTDQLIWLKKQLRRARRKGMQVYLTGHVPPNKDMWYEHCRDRYGQLVLQYQDTILGQLWGHMNVDHFSFFEAKDFFPAEARYQQAAPATVATSPLLHRGAPRLAQGPSSGFTPFSVDATLSPSIERIDDDLFSVYASVPPRKFADLDDYSIITVAPSVIPTYLPSLRVFTYNITKPEEELRWRQDTAELEEDVEDHESDDDEGDRSALSQLVVQASQGAYDLFDALVKKPKRRAPTPKPVKRHATPFSPSRQNSYLSLLGYTQYWLPLHEANKNSGYGPGEEGRQLLEERGEDGVRPPPRWGVEYVTYSAEELARGVLELDGRRSPIPKAVLPDSIADALSEVASAATEEQRVKKVREAIEADESLATYELDDLTITSWVGFARTLATSKLAWKSYVRHIFVSSKAEND